MKVCIYIEKTQFDKFFTWLNRIERGIIQQCPVRYSATDEGISNPLQILLSPDKYSIIQDTESIIEDIKKTWGNLDILFKPESSDLQKNQMSYIIQKSARFDSNIDLIYSALKIATEIPNITPLEALVIAEKEIANHKNVFS